MRFESVSTLGSAYSVGTLSSHCKCVQSAKVDERVEVEERAEVVKRAESDARMEVHAHRG